MGQSIRRTLPSFRSLSKTFISGKPADLWIMIGGFHPGVVPSAELDDCSQLSRGFGQRLQLRPNGVRPRVWPLIRRLTVTIVRSTLLHQGQTAVSIIFS